MLMYIRDRATGWIAWAIVILISIPFALWGVQEYLGPEQNVAVAEVNGEEVGYQEFQRAYAQLRSNLIRMLGGAASSELLDEERIRAQAMQQLINDRLVLQVATDTGMRIGDDQLAFAINSQPGFQLDGRFSQENYEAFLRSQGHSALSFEHSLRRDLVIGQMGAALDSAAIVGQEELARIVALRDQRRRYRELALKAANFRPESVEEAEVKAFYDANRDRFVTDEQVKIQYVEISRDDIAAAVPVKEDELRRYYESQQANYVTPEQREASHILIGVKAGADEGAVQKAEEQARALKARLDAGESFEDLAKAHSEDPGSSSQGGSLGWFGREVMDPAFEEAAFALEPGAVSDPVRSSFGIHLIKVTDVRKSQGKAFDEVRDELDKAYRDEQAEQEFFDKAERLANAAFENPTNLDTAAAAVDVEVETSEFLGRAPANNPQSGSSDIGRIPRVLEAAFSSEVLADGNNSELLELADDRVMVLRVAEHKASKSQTFEEVRSQAEELVKTEQAAAAAKAVGEALQKRLEGGESLEAVTAEAGEGAAWTEPALLGRTGNDPELTTALFSIPRPADGHTEYHGFASATGDYRLVALDRVVDGDASKLTDDERRQTDQTLTASLGRAEFEALVQGLREAAKVTVFDELEN